jgi:pimeloyl-ACP methyl ester carboxylesterase
LTSRDARALRRRSRGATRFILVHGAFTGAWEWEPLTPLLETKGHTVETPDLPGAGEDRTPVAEVTFDSHVERVRSTLGDRPEPTVLVGHSMGGMAITQAAALVPEQVAALIYVAAFLPEDGQSLKGLTELPEGADDQIQANMVVEGDPPVATLPEHVSRESRYNDCSEEVIAWALSHQRPQPLAPMLAPVSIPEEALDRIPRHYVRTLQDRSLPPALQRRMLTTAGVEGVVELDTGHNPQMSMTAELAEALDRLTA